MNTTRKSTVMGVNKRIANVVQNIMLFGMLHSTFVAPAQVILFDYFNAPPPIVTKWGTFYQDKQTDAAIDLLAESDEINIRESSEVFLPEIISSESKNNNLVYYSDIEKGFIGLSEQNPIDDARDNLFKLDIDNIPHNARAYLKYELYGVQDMGSVSRSINALPSTGGHLIKKNNAWSLQEEELDIKWLKEGENTVLFTAPTLKGYGYQIRNLRIEFAENTGFGASLVLNINKEGLLVKGNKVYIKGFISQPKEGLQIEAEGTLLSVYGNQFEGVIELTDRALNQKYFVIKANDHNGLVGQEIISLMDRVQADLFIPFEASSNAAMKLFPAYSKNELYTKGAGIIVPDSALIEKKNISITELRKKDIAPLNSGMINVTKNGTAYRFLPDGTKFEKEAKIILEYDSTLIPAGYSEKDIRSFYFNTQSKSWVSIEKDTIDLSSRMIISNTNHFTDYINGIVQVPETPESSAFIPTMMSDIKAADPSAGITLIAPPQVSQKGSAGVSYPLKVPAGRNGMQPNLAIQYNSDGGNGFLGLGWDINTPAISIDTRWGVPLLDDEFETEIYTLNGEQLMYPKRKNLDGDMVDWMPNRHFDGGLDVNNNVIRSTESRDRLAENEAIFTPRKQGSFAKIERKGNSPSNYYWKVISTDGTISWYGGADNLSNNANYVLKNAEGKIVHWSLYMVEDVFGNNIKYEYIKENVNTSGLNANLAGGVFYQVSKIYYTGHNGSQGNYSVSFNPTSGMREDLSIDSRLGVKLVTSKLLSSIDIRLGSELIRKYILNYEPSKFQKSRLLSIAEEDGNKNEFYKHEFEYYDDLTDGENDIYFSTGIEIDTCDEDENIEKCYVVSIPIPRYNIYNYQSNLGSHTHISEANTFNLLCKSYSIGNVQILQELFNQPNLFLSCGSNGQPDFSNCLTITDYLNFTANNRYYDKSNSNFYNESENISNQIFATFPEIIAPPSFVRPGIPSNKISSDYHFITNNINYAYGTRPSFSYSSTSDSMEGSFILNTPNGTPLFVSSPLNNTQTVYIPFYSNINGSPIYDSNYVYFTTGTGGSNGFDVFKSHILSVYPNANIILDESNDIITISISTTHNISTINLESIDNQISTTYEFIEAPCESTSVYNLPPNMLSYEDEWKNYKPSEEEAKFNIMKNIAEGNKLNLPFDDFIIEYGMLVENNENNLEPSVFFWYKSNYESFWKNMNGDKITTPNSVNALSELLPSDIEDIYLNLKSTYEEEEYEQRLIEQEEAKLWLENNNFFKNVEESNNLIIFNKTQENTFSDFPNIAPNYSYIFESFFGNPDCPSMVNAEFLIEGLIPSFNSYFSPLGSSATKSESIGGYLGIIGFGCNFLSKNSTLGFGYNVSGSRSKSEVSMIDINGDGLNDIVMQESGGFKYKPHIVNRTYDENGNEVISHSFGTERPITGISNFYNAVGKSEQINFSFNSYASVGWENTTSTSTTNVYFTDANGDGLIDIVKNAVVYFNRLDTNGDPEFIADSQYSENLVIVAEPLSVEEPVEEPVFRMPSYDVVKVWEAPANGIIKIENIIELTDLSKEATVTIEMKTVTDPNDPDPNDPDPNDPCFVVILPDAVKGIIAYFNGVMAPGIHQDYPEVVAALNANFPGNFTYSYINGVNYIFYDQGQLPITLTLDFDGLVETYYFEDCNSEEFSSLGFSNIKTQNSTIIENECNNIEMLCLLYGVKLNNNEYYINNTIVNFSNACRERSDSLTVKKGDRIYFRVHSVENGNPPVNWNPKVTYTNPVLAGMTDQNGYKLYESSYSDGFILSEPTTLPFYGQNVTVAIEWDTFIVNQASDEVFFKIFKQEIDLESGEIISNSKSLLYDSAGNLQISSSNLNNLILSETDVNVVQLLFVVESTSNVRWQDYLWEPRVITHIEEAIEPSEGILTSVETLYPTVDYTVYKQYSCGPIYSTYDISQLPGNVSSITPVYNGIFSADDYGKVHFVVKNNGQLVGSRTLVVNDGNLYSLGGGNLAYNNPISLQNLTGTEIEIGFYVEDAKFYLNGQTLASKLAFAGNSTVKIVNHNIPKEHVNIYHRNNKFGPMYRQWGQFFYNPDKVTGATPTEYGDLIKEDVLFRDYSEDDINGLIDLTEDISEYELTEMDTGDYLMNQLNNLQNGLDDLIQDSDAFLPARALREGGSEDKWISLHKENYATANAYRTATLQQSLSSEYELEPYNFQGMEATGAYGINKVFKSKGQNISGGSSFGVGVSASKSINGEGRAVTEYTDLNGDRYPDVVTTGEIQFTTRTGGLQQPTLRIGKESIITLNHNSNWGVGVSGGLGGNNDQSGSADGYPKNQVSVITNSTKPNTSIGLSINFSKGKNFTDSFWADVNGDGLPDLITKAGNNVVVYLNRGGKLENIGYVWNQLSSVFNSEAINVGGGVGLSLWNSSIQGGLSLTSSWNNTKNTFIDMNGDGLVDFVDTDDNLKVKINRGNRYLNAVNWSSFDLKKESVSVTASKNAALTFSLGFGIPFTDICIKFLALTGNGTLATSTNKTEKTIIDFDGDGFPDLIERLGDGNVIRVHHSRIRRTDKLKSVTNPLGGKFTLDYKVHKVSYDNPNPKWVMSSVMIEDGYDLVNDGQDIYKKMYEYENPRYDRRERDFYGFETVKSVDYTMNEEGELQDIYRTSVSKYHNRSYFLNGLLKETAVYKGDITNNELYSRSENNYALRALSDDNSIIDMVATLLPEDFDVGGHEGRRSAVALLSKTTSYVYELGSSPLVSESIMNYDEKARVVRFDYLGDPNDAQDNYSTEISYHDIVSLTDKNIIAIPNRVVVIVNGQTKRHRQTDNIDTTTGTIGTMQHFYTANDFAKVDLKYDQYGNITFIEYPENDNSERMSYVYEYDTTYNKHITQVTDAFGYSSQTEYNFKFDVPTQVTDIAGNITAYKYDTFGRLIEVLGPKEMQTNQSFTLQFEYFPKYSDIQSLGVVSENEFVPVALTKHYDPQHLTNTIDTYTFIDGLARPVQVKKDITVNKNANPSANPDYIERMSVSGAVTYDEFGRAIKQYHPSVEDKGTSINFVYNQDLINYFAESIYDPLDRVVETIDEAGSQALTEYTLDGNLHKTRSVVQQTSGVDIISESFKDVNGRVVKTNNIGPQGDIITLFNYNAIGELLSYTDDMGMSSGYEYDLLGRKSEMNHPDRGTTKYYYDKASNLTRLETEKLIAQSQYISYHYEYNRLKRIIFPEIQPGSANISDVYYEYGDPNSGNQTGRLIYQQDASGMQWFDYGNMGEMVYNRRTVVAPSPTLPNRTFETRFEYDSWNRLQSLVYPDGEHVNYSYDLGGNLNSIQGDMPYVQRVDYNHYGERTYILYGNGTETLYEYTPELRRLDNLQVFASNSGVLLNNNYDYDYVGNVTELVNSAGFNQVNYMGGKYQNKYIYDNLNRLVNANGDFLGSPQQQQLGNDYTAAYATRMSYNSTHGIVSKRQDHSKNGQAYVANSYNNEYKYFDGTHRLEVLTDLNTGLTEHFDYDPNGNMKHRHDTAAGISKQYFWDEADRLRVAIEEPRMHHYIYDAGGERVLKASSNLETVYENGELIDSNIQMGNYTTYPSAFLVVDPDGIFSKHYYAGTQRIAARLGHENADELFMDKKSQTTGLMNNSSESSTSDYPDEDELMLLQQQDLQQYLDQAEITATLSFAQYNPATDQETSEEGSLEQTQGGYGTMAEDLIYYYHPDHLGTATYLTDINGLPYEFFLNLPFGETMAEQHSQTGDYSNRWKFTGHELDRETGLYYAGARYYDPKVSIWLSVDPLAEEFPEWNPYHYVHQNPINLIDPTGESAEDCCGDNGDRPFGQPDFEQQPPKKEPIYLTAEIYSAEPLMGYPGQALEEDIIGGIQWLGEKLSGSDVSKETAQNIQTATNATVLLLSKGRNKKAGTDVLQVLTSRGARREVMRKEGIPTSQQPKSQSKNSSGREYTYEVPKQGGGTQQKSVQQQTKDRSHQGQPHWEAGKVKTDNGRTRMNNYNRPKLDNNKSKVNY